MEEEKNNAEKWIDDAGNLIETYRDLITIRVVEQTSLGASFSILGILALIFILCILLFFGLGAAWWIGESMQNRTAGFFIVGGTYLVFFGTLLLLARKFIIPALRNLIIKKIYDKD
jgi:hypothetical protein